MPVPEMIQRTHPHSVECLQMVMRPNSVPAALGRHLVIAVTFVLSVFAQVPSGEQQANVKTHLAQAQVHLDREEYSAAKNELEKALAIHANIPGAFYQLGLSHWHLRNMARARAAFLRELEFEPPDAHSLYYLGRIALGDADTAKAVKYFERVLSIGTVMDVRQRLASGYLRLGRVDAAVRLLEETVGRWPERGESHYLLGRAYQRLGRTEEARFEFELAERWKRRHQSEIRDLVGLRVLLRDGKRHEAVEKAHALASSGDPEVLFSTAVALGRSGFHKEALPLLRDVVDARPRHAEAFYNLARAQLSLGERDDALSALREAIDCRPEFYEARLLLGNLHAQDGDFEASIPHLRTAVRMRPDNAKAAALLGLQYMQGRYYTDAVDTLRTVVEIDPGNVDLRGLLVDAHYRNHDFERAVDVARMALADFPDRPNSHYQVAWQLENIGEFAEARKHAARALEIAPEFTEARQLLAETVLRLGDAEGSLAHFRQALVEDPTSGPTHAGLGKALVQLKRYEEAVSAMETAVEIEPRLASLRLSLSQAYRALGRMEEARREAALFAELNKRRAAERDRDVARTYRSQE